MRSRPWSRHNCSWWPACQPAGRFRVHAITDLGWPICLLDLALDVLAEAGSATPIYFSGYGRGYEEIPFPGLYDPATAGEVSPLVNALEASQASQSACPLVDAVPVRMTPAPDAPDLLDRLADTCLRTQDPAEVRGQLDELSWSLLHATLRAAPATALARMVDQATAHRDGLDRQLTTGYCRRSAWRTRGGEPGLVPQPGW